ESQDLRAEIFRAVGPAYAAAGNLAEAQMHAFDLGRVDENFVQRLWQRQKVQTPALNFERKIAARPTGGIPLEEARPQHRIHHSKDRAKDAIVIRVRHLVQGS